MEINFNYKIEIIFEDGKTKKLKEDQIEDIRKEIYTGFGGGTILNKNKEYIGYWILLSVTK